MLSALAVPAVASAHLSNISSARAYDVSIGGSVIGSDTGLISRPGTSPGSPNDPFTVYKTLLVLPANPLLEAGLLAAKTYTANEVAQAKATVAWAALLPQPLPLLPALSAKLITSTADATCVAGRDVLAGSVLGTLTLGTNTYNLATSPNTVINLAPLLTITLNEQVKNGNSITVNAVDIDLLGTHIILASSHAGVTNCALG